MDKNKRKSNFELLRIISMIFIILFHYVFKSGYKVETLTLNNYFIKLFWLLGEIGVNLFILISGYFMVKGKFSIKKVISLILEVIFYNSISAILAHTLGGEDILRIFYSPYSFVRMYIMLYFLSPFLNMLIQNITKKEYQKLLVICIIFWSIMPTFLGIFKNSTENLDFYSRMIWFIIIYLVGGYIRLYDIKFLNSRKKSLIFSTISFLLLSMSILVIYYAKILIPRLSNLEIAYLWGPNNIITFVFCISFFKLFASIDIGSNKIINKISSTTLGIYMIHDGLLRNYIWNNIFDTKEMLAKNDAIIHILIATIIIFVVGIIIDLIRQFIERKIIKPIIEKKSFDNFLENTKLKIYNIIDNML